MTKKILAFVMAVMVISAVTVTASAPAVGHPSDEAWNNGPHCHTQILGLLGLILTIIGMFLGFGFVMFVTPINIDCHDGGPYEV